MQKIRHYILILSAFALVFTGCSKDFQKLLRTGTVDQKYKRAIELYKKADYAKASILLEEIRPLLKGSNEQEMAYFYFAYCNFHQQQYSTASFLFKDFYTTFARSEKVIEATYMSALALYKDSPFSNLDQSSTQTAIESLQNFLNTYPDSPYGKECTDILKELRKKLERKAYDRALLYYTTKEYDLSRLKSAVIALSNFQKEYPDSDFNEDVAFVKVQAGYEYALNSFDTKKKERFQEAIGYYQNFIDKYPEGKKIKLAEKLYENSQKELELITNAEKQAEVEKATAGKVSDGVKN